MGYGQVYVYDRDYKSSTSSKIEQSVLPCVISGIEGHHHRVVQSELDLLS
jgi:hypothetical protein